MMISSRPERFPSLSAAYATQGDALDESSLFAKRKLLQLRTFGAAS
jgi:hypothetical protein